MAQRVSEQSIAAGALRDAHRAVCDRIAAAAERSGRRAEHVTLVAVTKNATPDAIRSLVELGQADLGENRVQQLTQRAPQLDEWLGRKKTLAGAAPKTEAAVPDAVRWHMIGHLQRNKVKQVAPAVSLIQSVDSLRLAEELHSYAAKADRTIDILLQVNTAMEAQKSGVAPPAVIALAEQIDTMVHLQLRGLMCMAPYGDNPEDARPVFARTREMFEEARHLKIGGEPFNILSMGMSDDFEVAIEEGSNMVRVGRALFGDEEG